MSVRQMHLNLAQPYLVGSLMGAWRHPSSDPEQALTMESIVELCQLAESACFDAIFLADSLMVSPQIAHDANDWIPLDPMLLLGALTERTERIGLIATVSTTFHHPYDVARKFATLDRLSGGRSGWNIVTSANDGEARLFGQPVLPDPVLRYDRAREFVELTMELWRSWEGDALVFDKESGLYIDPQKVRTVDHRGEHFRVHGQLNVPALPQGYPVLVQAGQSEPGREFAARYAEVIFTAQNDFDEACLFAKDIRARAERHGRDPGEIKILPGIFALVCDTESKAKKVEAELGALISPEIGLGMIRLLTGLDLSGYDLDGPVPSEGDLPDSARGKEARGSRKPFFLEWAAKHNATIRELMVANATRGHLKAMGTAEQVADLMEDWFAAGACDGFSVIPVLVNKVGDFVEGVVPLLRERQLFRNEYTGTTLRDHLGLPMPRTAEPAAAG